MSAVVTPRERRWWAVAVVVAAVVGYQLGWWVS